ncbi:MAG TPA: OmpA family protein [Bryobacteraceae bacterium]|nr:OmpA family protein [Bryobacteraceae bacterium]
MKFQLLLSAILAPFLASAAWPQVAGEKGATAPIYHVTVVERTVRAVNYQYRGGPTQIDFKGTVLLPMAKGEATVQSKAGRTEIDAKFQHLDSPQTFGARYLTFVLWAISPEGHAKNLGELMTNRSDRATMHVTTDLQAFGLIVTAEPYSTVRQPSDVVVMENQLRDDTIGTSEPIQAKYELLPRGQYTYTLPDGAVPAGGPKVSMSRYEATVEVYQAQNAVQIAKSAGADRYAPEVFNRASELLRQAQELNARKRSRSAVVGPAREAAETAEDARIIAIQRQHDAGLTHAQEQATQASQLLLQAQARAQTSLAEAASEKQLLDRERAARERAEAQAAAERVQPTPPPQPPPPPATAIERRGAPLQPDPQTTALRGSLMQQLSAALPTRDTPRGLVVTVTDAGFRGTEIKPATDGSLFRIAAILASHPGLNVEVEGHTDTSGNPSTDDRISSLRAEAVRSALVRGGAPASAVSARGLGGTRPLVSNSSAAGREQNRRVEIAISGEPLGTMALWERSYSVVPRQ